MRLRWHHFRNRRNKPFHETLLFLLRLLALSVPLYLVSWFLDLAPLQVATASQAAFLLDAFGIATAQAGAAVTLLNCAGGPYTFVISPDSTAWKSLIFFSALVLAVPGVAWRKRLIGLGIGLPLLWLANLGRVLAIAYAALASGPETALLAHDVLWRFGLVAAVLVLWLAWLRFARLLGKQRSQGRLRI